MVPTESRADTISHVFWKQGTTPMFDIQIFNLDTGSYLRMTPERVLVELGKYKKYKYLQAFLDPIRTFTPVVYSVGIIPRAEALVEKSRLDSNIIFNLKD